MVTAAGFILGAILGSFAKAAAERVIKKKSFGGRSYCLSCKKTLRWYDLFPIFSFIFLRGKCRYCKAPIPLELFLTELFLGVGVALLFYTSPLSNLTEVTSFNARIVLQVVDLIFKLFVVVILTIIFWVDLKTGLILDKITYPSIIFSAVFLVIFNLVKSFLFYQDLRASSLGKYLLPPYSDYFYNQMQRIWISVGWSFISAIGASLVFILLIIITKGRGMGWGDVKFVFFLGLILGFPNILVGLFLAFLLGAIFSVGLIILGKKHFGQTIPFGPFLSLGAFIALIYGPQIINWYLKGFRL